MARLRPPPDDYRWKMLPHRKFSTLSMHPPFYFVGIFHPAFRDFGFLLLENSETDCSAAGSCALITITAPSPQLRFPSIPREAALLSSIPTNSTVPSRVTGASSGLPITVKSTLSRATLSTTGSTTKIASTTAGVRHHNFLPFLAHLIALKPSHNIVSSYQQHLLPSCC